MSKDTQMPAFPASAFCFPGMTLNDYFAGQVLAGYMADANLTFSKDDNVTWQVKLARECYLMADAMMEVRNECENDDS